MISYWGVDHGSDEVHKAFNPARALSGLRDKQVARVGQRAFNRGKQAAGSTTAPMGGQLSGRAGKMPKTFTERSRAFAGQSYRRGYDQQSNVRLARNPQSDWTPRERP